jgi:RsiW-degrading membrane proteinase PrsW (M82 family)
MSRPRSDDSLDAEPALTGRSGDLPVHSAVADEPALAGVEVDRGAAPGHAEIYRQRRAAVTPLQRWGAVGAAVLVAGPLSVVGTFIGSFTTASWAALVLGVVLFGPIIEELLKASGALYLAEQRPWLVPRASTLVLVTMGAALTFATIENLLYLNVYIDEPDRFITVWRWTVATALHVTASCIAGIGIAKMWLQTDRNGEAPNLRVAQPWLVGAAVLHGTYNLAVTIAELTDVI